MAECLWSFSDISRITNDYVKTVELIHKRRECKQRSKLKTDRTSRSPWAEKDSKCFHWNINSDWSRSSHYSGHPYLRAGQEVKILVIILGVMGKTQPILWAQRDWPRKTQPFSSGEWGRRNWPEIRRPALPWHSYPGAINFPSVCQFRTGTISPRKKDTTMQGRVQLGLVRDESRLISKFRFAQRSRWIRLSVMRNP